MVCRPAICQLHLFLEAHSTILHQACKGNESKERAKISDLEPEIVMYAYQSGLRKNSPMAMGLTINEVHTIAQFL